MVSINGVEWTPDKNPEQKKTAPKQEQQANCVFLSDYKIQAKDNPFSISRKLGIPVSVLIEANGWKKRTIKQGGKEQLQILDASGKPLKLEVGETIKTAITQSPQTNTESIPQKENNTPNISSYIIKSNDAPFKIAEKYQISIRQLADANGWEVEYRGEGKDKQTVVTNNGKLVVLNKGASINLPNSVTKNIGKVSNLTDVKSKAGVSEGLTDIISLFEGNPKNNYKPYLEAYDDKKGTWTIGFGYTKGVKKGSKMTSAQAHLQLAKDLKQIQEDIRIELGDETFNKMPKSVKEGLIDLIFNKGFEALDVEKFRAAIGKDDMKSVIKQLIYTKSMTDNSEMNGLYKRSLARIAHVYKGLSIEDKLEIKPIIDNFYIECSEKLATSEINRWWELDDSSQINNNSTVIEEPETEVQEKVQKTKINKSLLSEEIVSIKNMDLDCKDRLAKTNSLIDNYVKDSKISERAIEIFKSEAKKEYIDSWFWVNTDKLTAMTGLLDAQDAPTIYAALQNAIDESDEATAFASEVISTKINKDNIAELIRLAGGSKKFINLMKKVGDFETLKHSLICLTEDKKEKNELLLHFNKAQKEEDYSEIRRIFDNVLAESAKQISDNLDKTLVDDDDLNSILYKYQIKRVNVDNIIDVLKENDIIAGICEADNEREVCKKEIEKLFKTLDKNFELDEKARSEFLEIFNREFRERSIINPTTWWIGTEKVSEAFNKLLQGDLRPKDLKRVICQKLGWTEEDLNPTKNSNPKEKVVPQVETIAPTGDGALSGMKIVVNSGHGGFNPSDNVFDKGANNDNLGISEWMLNQYVSKIVIERLAEQGAEIVFTSGHINVLAHKNYNEDLRISLHTDSHNGTAGPRIYAYRGDNKDFALGHKMLEEFVNSEDATNVVDLKRAEKTFNLTMSSIGHEDTIQAKVAGAGWRILERTKKNSLSQPAILYEVCNIKDDNEVKNFILGKYGEEVINSIVNGIIKYREESM